jgi:hypothetical protein
MRGSVFIVRRREETRKARRFAAASDRRKRKATASVFGKHRRKEKERWEETLTSGTHMSAAQGGKTRPLRNAYARAR